MDEPRSNLNDGEIEALTAAGRYQEAAELAQARGQFGRAADLFERIWDFGRAAECAQKAGELGRALRHAIDARNESLVQELAAALSQTGPSGQRAAMEALADKRRFAQAARYAEDLGEMERAIDYYRSAHRDLEAARLLERHGRDREAGRLLERFIELSPPGPERAEAHLRLGMLLSRRMRYDNAARHLQEAARHGQDATRQSAERGLVMALAAMGLRDAARDVLLSVRSRDPDVPADIDQFLRQMRQDAAASTAPAEPAAEVRAGKDDADIIGGRYRLQELLGAGTAGRVFRAWDEVAERACAVKLLHTAPARGNQAYERFVREAKLAGSLRHPNIVEVYDFSADQGYLVMEHLGGGSLASKIAGKPLGGALVRRLAAAILAGLKLAHQRGIIHRDIKPGNIFFDARGTAKLGDFGVAHLLDLGHTQTGGLIGTLAYMAPEQITGARLTFAADLYAMGITLFEALTGRLPFLGPDFVAQHLGEAPPPPSSVAAAAKGWDAILARLLAKNPAERYASLDEAREALSALEQEQAAPPSVLVLHRPSLRAEASQPGQQESGPRPDGGEQEHAESGAPAADAEASRPEQQAGGERYQFETALGRTENSLLSRGLDTVLNRSIIIERFDSALDEATEQRLYALARGGGPFLQRALAYDRAAHIAVFEAPTGVPLAEAMALAPLARRDAARFLKRLARALAPVHASHMGHGALGSATVLVDDEHIPTILVSGLGPVTALPRPEEDIARLIDLTAKAMGLKDTQHTAESLIAALLPSRDSSMRRDLAALAQPRTGEDLYALADAIEIAILREDYMGR